jgi:hypothetical protein
MRLAGGFDVQIELNTEIAATHFAGSFTAMLLLLQHCSRKQAQEVLQVVS